MTALPPISKFPQVDQADASGELAKIYDDIRSTLRMPWVPFAIRVMSQFPALDALTRAAATARAEGVRAVPGDPGRPPVVNPAGTAGGLQRGCGAGDQQGDVVARAGIQGGEHVVAQLVR